MIPPRTSIETIKNHNVIEVNLGVCPGESLEISLEIPEEQHIYTLEFTLGNSQIPMGYLHTEIKKYLGVH